MRKHAVAASAAAVLLGITGVSAGTAASATPTDPPAQTAAPRTPKTLVIGVDGASYDVLAQAETPAIHALQQGGLTATSNLPASPMAPTVSGAGWSTIATGVWPDKHRVTDNNFTNPNYAQFPDYLTRIERAAPQRSTLVVGTWGPISTTVFGSAVDERIQGKDDADTTAKTIDRLSKGNPDDVFVHLDEVDGAGHSTGSSSAAYRTALQTADQQIAKIVGAVEQRPGYANEDWLIVVTADHGHTPTGGHGGASRLERKTFVIAKGSEFPAGTVRDDVKIADIAPTVLAHDGIARDSTWELDGEAVTDIVPDAFDALRPKLRGAVDEKGLVGITGWTNEAPEGWTVDNSKMPTGGSTEFRGWTFMTDDFFSNAELGQHRENNVRSRNVFAVADSDEWDDVSPKSSRNFDSTLVTPEYPLNGAATVDISFVSDYAVDDPQGAGVRVSFDEASGLQPQKLVDYPANGTRANPVNQVEHFSYELPRDAKGQLPKSIRLNFSYSGINSAFWVIDQVRVSQPDAPTPDPAAISVSAPSVVAGGTATVSGTGFEAGERLALELHSTPVPLGTVTAGTDGSFSQAVTIPAGTAAGQHALVAKRADGSEVSIPLSVTAAPSTGSDGTGSSTAGSGANGGSTASGNGTTAGGTSAASGASTASGNGTAAGTGTAGAGANGSGAGANGGTGATGDGLAVTGAEDPSAAAILAGSLLALAGAGVALGARSVRRARRTAA